MLVAKRENIKRASISFLFVFLSFYAFSQFNVILNDSMKSEVLIANDLRMKSISNTDYSVSRYSMPIFCKWELDIMDATGIPVKFRLGSQDYVDKLENKTNNY